MINKLSTVILNSSPFLLLVLLTSLCLTMGTALRPYLSAQYCYGNIISIMIEIFAAVYKSCATDTLLLTRMAPTVWIFIFLRSFFFLIVTFCGGRRPEANLSHLHGFQSISRIHIDDLEVSKRGKFFKMGKKVRIPVHTSNTRIWCSYFVAGKLFPSRLFSVISRRAVPLAWFDMLKNDQTAKLGAICMYMSK